MRTMVKNKSIRDSQLEDKIFKMTCYVSMGTSAFFFMVDLFFTRDYISLPVEFLSIVVFYTYLRIHKNTANKPRLFFYFIIALLVLTDVSWFTGGGLNIPNASILYLSGMVAIILSTGSNRKQIFTSYFLNIAVIAAIHFYIADDIMSLNIARLLFMIIAMVIGAFILVFFKKSYDQERNIIQHQLKILDAKNGEIIAQNEELLQQQEEIISQRDYIEENNRKLTEANEEIKTINDTLEEKVRVRTSKLKHLNNDLDMLFYRSSHDFRQPLTSLIGLSNVAKISPFGKEAKELFEHVNLTAINMDKMLNKFLMLYKINHYQNLEPINLKLIENSLRNRLRLNPKTNLNFEYNTEGYSDTDRRNFLLETILYNMVENSIQYSNSQPTQIDVSIKNIDQHLVINVKDNGIGIPDNYLDSVFDIYFRGNINSQGNGLGLYVAKKAVEKLNGSVTVNSIPHKKTEFEVNFPI